MLNNNSEQALKCLQWTGMMKSEQALCACSERAIARSERTTKLFAVKCKPFGLRLLLILIHISLNYNKLCINTKLWATTNFCSRTKGAVTRMRDWGVSLPIIIKIDWWLMNYAFIHTSKLNIRSNIQVFALILRKVSTLLRD